MSKEEVTFSKRKRSQTNVIWLDRSPNTTSTRSIGNDKASCTREANSANQTVATTGIMGNLATFRCLHQQSGTDALLFYQQTGLIALEL